MFYVCLHTSVRYGPKLEMLREISKTKILWTKKKEMREYMQNHHDMACEKLLQPDQWRTEWD